MRIPGLGHVSRTAEWPRVVLGALFLTAGVAKVPVVEKFGIALEQMMPLGSTLAWLVAGGVVVAEIMVGVMLLLGMRTRRAAFAALTMAGAFAGFQAGRLLRGVEAPCHCLGILGNLPGGAELSLDLVLVSLSLAVIGRADERALPETVGQSMRHAWLAVVIPASFLSIPLVLRDMPMITGQYQAVLEKLKTDRPAVLTGERGLVLCLNLDEFHCALCFDDLVSLLDTLQTAGFSTARDGVAAVLRSGETFPDSSGWELRRWARETGITGPLVVLEAREFDGATGGKSALWMVERMDHVVRCWDLPLGAARQSEVLASLRGE
jgi:uncharacterized membrane protein YphA (DoxX/SURF4 family)